MNAFIPAGKKWESVMQVFSRKKTALPIITLILGTAVFFAVSVVVFSSVFPADSALYDRVNSMFLLCPVPAFWVSVCNKYDLAEEALCFFFRADRHAARCLYL